MKSPSQGPPLPSEFRRDLVSGAWITIATGRARRPSDFASRREHTPSPLKTCPFEDLAASGHAKPLLVLANKQKIQVVPNRFPIVEHRRCPLEERRGPYEIIEGVGFHEVVVFGDHMRQLADLEQDEVALVLEAYQSRYRSLAQEPCVRYVLVFHNFGEEAGASLWHPHSQIIAIPVLPSDVERSLRGSREYWRESGQCVHCVILGWEQREKTRIIFENKEAVALAPFISRNAFEIRIFPKKHNPRFESESQETLKDVAEVLLDVLKRLKKGMHDPAYNYFLHTAPPRQAEGEEKEEKRELVDPYSFYHWHIEILPRTDVSAGFELGTGIEVAVVDPDEAAAFLRNISL